MSKLSTRKSRLRAEFDEATREQGKMREVVMELKPWSIRVKLKGTRTWFEVSPVGVYNFAVRVAVEKARAEKGRSKGRRR